MAFRRILIVSDNETILTAITDILREQNLEQKREYTFVCSPQSKALINKEVGGYTIKAMDMRKEAVLGADQYDLVISAHCKQLFPPQLVNDVQCINIHPGYNPHNRGWYPQVFSILNKLPLGATIHEIDEELDHGKIIAQEQVPVYAWDTSYTAYERVQALEVKLLQDHLANILNDQYTTRKPTEEGNLNLKQDFKDLQEIGLDEEITYQEAIDRLRALSHPPYRNAYFIDPATKKKIWLRIELYEDKDNGQ